LLLKALVLSFKIYHVQLVTRLWNVNIVKGYVKGKENIEEHRNGSAKAVTNTSGMYTGKEAMAKELNKS
jgi:hypothetical protein